MGGSSQSWKTCRPAAPAHVHCTSPRARATRLRCSSYLRARRASAGSWLAHACLGWRMLATILGERPDTGPRRQGAQDRAGRRVVSRAAQRPADRPCATTSPRWAGDLQLVSLFPVRPAVAVTGLAGMESKEHRGAKPAARRRARRPSRRASDSTTRRASSRRRTDYWSGGHEQNYSAAARSLRCAAGGRG